MKDMKKDKKWVLDKLNKIEPFAFGDEYRLGFETGIKRAKTIVEKLDEPEKVGTLVVPKKLGEWLDKQKLGTIGSYFSMIGELEVFWNAITKYGPLYNFIDANKRALIEVILGTRPYEVEKEKLYRVELPSGHNMYMSGGKGKASYSYMPIGYTQTTPNFLFTEAQIKAIDERYWAFAVEVAE